MPKQTYVERVLIVLNQDGTLKGAHQESLTRILDGDEVLMERQEAAQPLAADALAAILPDSAALLAEVIPLREALTAKTSEVEALTAQLPKTDTASDDQAR